jgi:type II secretory pathway pseudopilin PulG
MVYLNWRTIMKIVNLNKGTMFGLDCRALKKQFGKLFLASRHSEAPQGVNNSCGYAKRGAMFGLDARIALAIFGALSVISGAALYSAIQSARAEQWRQYFTEVSKATEAYYLDNYKQLIKDTSSAEYLSIGHLVSNGESLSTWQGPYLQGVTETSGLFPYSNIKDSMTAQISTGAYINIYLRQSSTWTEMNDVTTDELCASGSSDCAQWISLCCDNGNGNVMPVFNSLDNLIDGNDGQLAGIVRLNSNSGAIRLMYKGIPHKKN